MSESKSKVYKAIWLPEETAKKIKLLATKNNQTIIQFIGELLTHPYQNSATSD